MDLTLIANSGIQLFTFRVKIDTQERFKLWFHEWYDTDSHEWRMEPVQDVKTEDETLYYKKMELYNEGLLPPGETNPDIAEIRELGLRPLKIDDEMQNGVAGEIYGIGMSDKNNRMADFENKWLPLPYFHSRTASKFSFGPLNWTRFKMIPVAEEKGVKTYDVLLAFDTKTYYNFAGASNNRSQENEAPVFTDRYKDSMDFGLCSNIGELMKFCMPGKQWSFIFDHLMKTVHPEVSSPDQISGRGVKHMGFVTSYIYLISFLAQTGEFPKVRLYKDADVVYKSVDMVIDIGNSSTTALLIEDNSNFNQVRPLSLINFTDLLVDTDEGKEINRDEKPFDMRLAFRKVDFGNFGLKDSTQFVYPSLVRVGLEANRLIHSAINDEQRLDKLSTYSSPKRYLWDGKANNEEWQFLVLPGEPDDHIISLPGITSQLKSNGQFDPENAGGTKFQYSRRSLMTLAFLEMIAQAKIQINSDKYRSMRHGLGEPEKPRKIKRIIVTCPTAMSRVEREALIRCAKDAVNILSGFYGEDTKIQIIPSSADGDGLPNWYYDEATCSQLVYMFGEVGHKYKGNVGEFFSLYGKTEDGESKPSLTVGSLDIGAGTSDLMISKYTYKTDSLTTITPEPLFYDSFYFAGDDMLHGLIKNIMLLNEKSAFRKALKDVSFEAYRQKMKNFFGPDYSGQTLADRILRKDFNIQYSIPLMYYFLELARNDEPDRTVSFDQVFADCQPNESVIKGFKDKTGIDVRDLQWDYNREEVSSVIEREFDPLLKKIATIMYAYACDIVLLSGRPASLPAVKNIFLTYYPVAANRLILLNNYYVGDWYPFGDNTGYITNPKTIVAMGGVIAHYATELSNLNNFIIDISKLKEGLKSTVNYIAPAGENNMDRYFITPETPTGEIMISNIPVNLDVRQVGMDTYPKRTLYTIDFNRHKINDRLRRRAFHERWENTTDAHFAHLVNEEVEKLRARKPFTLSITRDPEDYENLIIESITDKNGEEVAEGNIDIHIQSLGADDQYWMDSGAFNF